MSPLRILFAFMFHRFDFVNSNSRHSRLKNVYRSVYSLLIELIPKPCQDKCLPFPWNRPTPLQAAPNDLDGSTVSLKDQDGALLEPIGTTKNIAGETIMQCTSLTSQSRVDSRCDPSALQDCSGRFVCKAFAYDLESRFYPQCCLAVGKLTLWISTCF